MAKDSIKNIYANDTGCVHSLLLLFRCLVILFLMATMKMVAEWLSCGLWMDRLTQTAYDNSDHTIMMIYSSSESDSLVPKIIW